jgi:L-threonylcarbamoyladenylate synthase
MLYWDDKNTISKIHAILRSGGVVVGSSDTVIGFLASLTKEGFEALNSIKQRQEKPYLILVESQEVVEKLIDQPISGQIRGIMERCWPGPLTIIFKAKVDLPAYIKGADGTIALRVPAHSGLQQLLACGDSLFSTSANKAGEPVPASLDELDPDIRRQVAAVIDDYSGSRSKDTVPSTILDCSDGTIRVVREGAYPIAELLKQ